MTEIVVALCNTRYTGGKLATLAAFVGCGRTQSMPSEIWLCKRKITSMLTGRIRMIHKLVTFAFIASVISVSFPTAPVWAQIVDGADGHGSVLPTDEAEASNAIPIRIYFVSVWQEIGQAVAI
jgi:hypothetical protein